jgi:hypothetical protein
MKKFLTIAVLLVGLNAVSAIAAATATAVAPAPHHPATPPIDPNCTFPILDSAGLLVGCNASDVRDLIDLYTSGTPVLSGSNVVLPPGPYQQNGQWRTCTNSLVFNNATRQVTCADASPATPPAPVVYAPPPPPPVPPLPDNDLPSDASLSSDKAGGY